VVKTILYKITIVGSQPASRSVHPYLHSSAVCPTQTHSARHARKRLHLYIDCASAVDAPRPITSLARKHLAVMFTVKLLNITGHYITDIRNAHLLQFVHRKSQQFNKVTRRETNDCRVECTDDADRKHSYPLVQTCHYIARQHQRVSNTERHSPSSSGRARSTNF